MKEIVALDDYSGSTPSLFLAGGISGTNDWQCELRALLEKRVRRELVLLNPRRRNFPIDDPGAARAQIEWEHRHLRHASAISFWFPPETLCPIALYELGAWSASPKPIFVATHPSYARRTDVVIQTELTRPGVRVGASLQDLADRIVESLG